MSLRTPFRLVFAACVAAPVFVSAVAQVPKGQAPRFEVTVDPATRAAPLTGRLVVVVSKLPTPFPAGTQSSPAQPEPRMLIAPQGPALFAIDLEQLRAGQPAIVDTKSLGYPVPLASLPAGDYY